ncbi:MAG: hypothetical protein AAF658_13270, partial [Myxococcota bacterium]
MSTPPISAAPGPARPSGERPEAASEQDAPCDAVRRGVHTADCLAMPLPAVVPRSLLSSSDVPRSSPIAVTPSGVEVAAVFTGRETFNLDGTLKLWSKVERLNLPDSRRQTPFNEGLAWPKAAASAPFVADMYGTSVPSMDTFLLHYALGFEQATGKPTLIVHGAGDNASRVAQQMASQLSDQDVPVAAITLPHPHGDPRENADLIAAAIERLKQETGAKSVDVVTHSAGFHSVAVYNANHSEDIDWGWDYPPKTLYRGDIAMMLS